jgi:DNA polymerase
MASKIYGREISKADKTERALGKAAFLGLGYSCGANKFAYIVRAGLLGPPMEIADEEAAKIVNIYRSSNNHIQQLWRDLQGFLYQLVNHDYNQSDFVQEYRGMTWHNSKLMMPNGLYLRYAGLHQDQATGEFLYQARSGYSRIYGGKIVENITQSLARSIVAEQAIKIAQRYRIALLVHDEVVLVVPEAEADEALAYGINIMSTPPAWAEGLPLGAEGGYDVCYSK